MFTTTNPKQFSPTALLLEEYVGRYRQNSHSAQTEKGKAIRRAAQSAFHEGIATGLAAIGTAMRADRFSRWDGIPVMSDFEFSDLLSDVPEKYTEFFGGKRGDDRARARVQWNEWWIARMDELVFPEKLLDAEVQRRRQAILDGNESPLIEDHDWLEEQIHLAEERARRLAAAREMN